MSTPNGRWFGQQQQNYGPFLSSFWMVLCWVSLCTAQSPPGPWVQWTEKDGLPENTLLTLCSDQQNQLWIGTANGLARFDGNSFKAYNYNPLDTNSLPADRILSLHIDSQGKIWVGTSGGGLARYLPDRDAFDRSIGPILEDRITCVTENRSGELIVGYRAISDGPGGIGIMDSTGRLNHFLVGHEDYAGFKMKISAVLNDPEEPDTYWIGGRSFFRWNRQTNEVKEYYHPEMVPNYNVFTGIHAWDENTLLAGSFYSGLLLFDKKNNQWLPSLHAANVYKTIERRNGDILFCSNQGLGLLKKGQQQVEYLFHLPSGKGGLPKNLFIISIHEDKRGNVWLATNQGLFLWNEVMSQFPTYQINGEAAEEIKAVYITTNPSGQSIFRSLDGLYITDTHYQLIRKIPFPGKDLFWFSVDPDNTVWLYSRNRIFKLDEDWTNILSYPLSSSQKQGLDSVFLYSANRDADGRFWLGTRNHGLFMIQAGSDTLINFRHDPQNSNSLCHDHYIFEVQEADNGLIWIATDKGLSILDPIRQDFLHYPKLDEKLSDKIIHCLEPDLLGNMWIGTRTQGLFRFSENDRRLKQFTVTDGLPFNGVNKLQAQDHLLWICSRRGLSKLDLNDLTIQSFDQRDGLVANSLYTSRIRQSPQGKVVINYPSSTYFTVFDEQDLALTNTPPYVYLQQLNLLSQTPVQHLSIPSDRHFLLASNENYISIDFNGIHFIKQKDIQLQYRLLGYDTVWVDAANNRSAVFTNLSGGDYTFQVRGRINQETWGTTGQLTFFIATPWYKTLWFRIVLTLGILSLAAWIIRRQIRRIRKESALRQRLAETEIKALRAQINPHFIFNCLNSIKHFIIQKNVTEGIRHISRFSKLIRIVLNNSGERFISLEKELEALELYLELEQMRFDQQFTFQINNQLAAHVGELMVPPLLLQPYVENAIWHGIMPLGNGSIQIRIWEENDEVNIQISDNGIGRKASLANKAKTKTGQRSMGMQLNASRVDILNRYYQLDTKINITDLHPQESERPGTLVELKIPAINKQYIPYATENHTH